MDYHFGADVMKLKAALREAAVREIAAFRKATGVTPAGVQIEMQEVTTRDDDVRQFVVVRVNVDIKV